MNLNSPRVVPVGKLTEADIDRLLEEQRADMAAALRRRTVDARAALHEAAGVEMIDGIPVTPLKDLRRPHPGVPRERVPILAPFLNVAFIAIGFAAAHWRRWAPAVIAIGLSGWWLFR